MTAAMLLQSHNPTLTSAYQMNMFPGTRDPHVYRVLHCQFSSESFASLTDNMSLVDAIPLNIQALGGDTGLKAMESAGFTELKTTPVPIPLYVPSSFELRDLFPFMVKPTPVNVREKIRL